MRKPESKRVDSMASGFVCRSEKTSWSSLEEKRQLVHEIAQCLDDAPAVLNSFTRKELLEIICAEVGKECKCSGFTKPKMIEYLLELVARKCNKETVKNLAPPSPSQDEKKFNKQRKNKYLSQLTTESDQSYAEIMVEDQKLLLCGNLACRAALSTDDAFCKRCSCCICHQYDENKDPSLWLTCDYNYPEEGELCGISCHLKCVLEHEPMGMKNQDSSANLDGYFCCVSCRKSNEVMRTWRKQLVVAKEARRVDVLCLRLSLSYKILVGTNKYKELLKIVESAVTVLENEVGPLHRASATMDRRIVNRLSCGAQVQKLCASAVEAFDRMMASKCFDHVNEMESPAIKIHFEASSPAKVTIVLEYEDCILKDILGCRLWYRRYDRDYPQEPTYAVLAPVERLELYDLDPSTQYFCKISVDGETRTPLGVCEANWITPAQAAGEHTNEHNSQMRTESMNSSDGKVALSDDHSKELSFSEYGNKSDGSPTLPSPMKNVSLASPSSNAPSTPCKSDGTTGMPQLVSKRQVKETDYEYAVRVIRKLEHEGHLGSDFRVKFLAWFSLKATVQEKRVVSVFVDTFVDDPSSLAGQLLDTFEDEICSEEKLASSHRFCTRLWH
ncbi:VIN3-like protein 2 [Coffea arabica]|uniref:VIN3-like protein 2 n=1 Tax=Coffea arabica TaxID=13443 RepID=A0A6P6UJT0_COFAR|nr:VIN3-like protein 2 [Coffea arabica]